MNNDQITEMFEGLQESIRYCLDILLVSGNDSEVTWIFNYLVK